MPLQVQTNSHNLQNIMTLVVNVSSLNLNGSWWWIGWWWRSSWLRESCDLRHLSPKPSLPYFVNPEHTLHPYCASASILCILWYAGIVNAQWNLSIHTHIYSCVQTAMPWHPYFVTEADHHLNCYQTLWHTMQCRVTNIWTRAGCPW